ncbi:unnamed protein product [Dovyalis caffra]|uniref:NAD(P)H dehydrogenase (quinone) n=1 Tax=Dovyalis caffra TaxID=77055 RepID=A0AAV1RBK5_9ROSI|nr:unnamed protein product [Dovyalis caffra]
MISRPKNGWHSIIPLSFGGKAVTGFCIFPKVKSAGYSPGNTPVYLNVYDLTNANGYVYWAGFGIFHSGVEVHGVEYAFGAHDYPSSGVFEVEPRQCPGFKFRKSIFMGTTCLDPKEVREFMEHLSANYNGDTYHLIVKNCNHFCEDTCYKLTGNRIPKWVNRLARIGSLCNCILPEALKATKVQHDPNYQERQSEKKRLRSSFSCFSSISMPQKEVSMSSLFLHSHYKGCLPPWELKRLEEYIEFFDMGKGGGCVPSKRRLGVEIHDQEPHETISAISTQNQTTSIGPRIPAQYNTTRVVKKCKIYIIFYSMYGHVELMARRIKKGVDSVDGVEGVLYRVPETLPQRTLEQMKVLQKGNEVPLIKVDELVNADGFLFGFPTRFGSMAAQMKAFFDSTHELWMEQKLAGVPAGFFVSTGTQGGGQETTALTAITQLAHHGMLFVPIGYTFGAGMFRMDSIRGGSPYGAGVLSGDGTREPSATELALAEHQGKYMATLVKRFARPFSLAPGENHN